MSTQGEFCVPGDDILRELGRIQVLHSQFDHTLRLAIKRMLGISIDDPGYWNEKGAETTCATGDDQLCRVAADADEKTVRRRARCAMEPAPVWN